MQMKVAVLSGGGLDAKARAHLVSRFKPTVIACTPSYALYLGRVIWGSIRRVPRCAPCSSKASRACSTRAYQATAYHRRHKGLELTSSGRIVSQLSYTVSANLFHNQIDATALGESTLQSTSGINAKFKLDYQPTSADSAQLSFTRTDKRLTAQGTINPVNIVNVGYKRRATPELTAVVTFSDVFNGQRNERFAITPTFTGEYVRAVQGRVVFFGLIYSFGSELKDQQFEYDQAGG
jgi:outer membrane receptor for ferrienterochelin and colicin